MSVIIEVDEQGQQTIKVVITLSDPMMGTFENLGGFVEIAPGVYQFNGTGADATTAIQGLRFVPMENWVMVDLTETFGFNISVMDDDPDVSQPITVEDDSITIDVTAVNDPPVLTGTVAGQTVYFLDSLRPFSAAVVTEVDDHEQQQLSVTIALDDSSHGFLTSPSGSFTDQGGGAYAFQGTAAQATVALMELAFTPTPNGRLTRDVTPPADSEPTQFMVTVDDAFGGIVVDTTTTVETIDGLIGRYIASDADNGDNMG